MDSKRVQNYFKDIGMVYVVLFVGLLVLSITLRVPFLKGESIWNDAAVHLWTSLKLLQEPLSMFSLEALGNDYVILHYITAFYYLFVQDIFVSGKLMAVTMAVFGITIVFLLGREIKDSLTGLLAAGLFSFHWLFFFLSTRPLADAPVATMYALVAFCIIKMEKEKTLFWSLAVPASMALGMATKAPLVLTVPAYLVYLLLTRGRKIYHDRNALLSLGTLGGLLFIVEVVFFFVSGRSFVVSFFHRFFSFVGMDSLTSYVGMLPTLFGFWLLALALLGAVFGLLYKSRAYLILVLLFFSHLLFFEVSVGGQALPRYMSGLFPFVMVLSALALTELKEYLFAFVSGFVPKKQQMFLRIALIVLICIPVINIAKGQYERGAGLAYDRSFGYTGYQEAAKWINDNAAENAVVYAGSPRSMRAFTAREYYISPNGKQYGGSLYYLRGEPYLSNRSAFEQEVAALSKERDVYVEIDVWEYTQPSWYYPLRQDSVNYFVSLGFELVHVVERAPSAAAKEQKTPVILLLRKTKTIS